jgi:cysteine desulfurase
MPTPRASGTESNNLALAGAADASGGDKVHMITSAFEHPSVPEPYRRLQRRTVEVKFLRPDSAGPVDPDDLRCALRPGTRLVSIMAANNVVGKDGLQVRLEGLWIG